MGKNNFYDAELRYRTLFDLSPDGILLIDTRGNILEFNDTACRDLGYSREEFKKLRLCDINSVDTPEKIKGRIDHVTKTGEGNFEVKHRAKNSEIRDVQVITRRLDFSGETVFYSIWRDITERRKAEQEIRQAHTELNQIFETTSAGIILIAKDFSILRANRTFLDMLGLSAHEIKEKKCFDLFSAGSPCNTADCPMSRIMDGEERVEFSTEKAHKDGSMVPCIVTAAPYRNPDGELIGMLEDIRDMREHRKAETELRDSREFIKSILNTVDEGFIVVDRAYRIISANKAYCKQVSLPLESIIGQHCHKVSHKSDRPCFETGEDCAVRHTFETGEPFVYTHRHYDTGGNVIHVETKSYPLRDIAGNVTSVIEVVNNITDRHLLEEQVLRTQKLEAVGLLAGGLAHDFNNLLQGVFGSISLAKMFSEAGGKAFQMLEGAEAALKQAKDLTKQLLTFSKGGEPVKKVISLPPVIHDSVKFSLSGSNVNCEFCPKEDVWPVEADEGQISQVINNIVLNASDAMPEGGTVRIKISNVLMKGKRLLPLKRGKYVLMSIEDSGIGIPENYISKIFDPYFTTKKKGSGLGLATTFSIVKKHGGILDVKSEPGRGSTFFIYLPASESKLPPAKEDGEGIIGGKGRVLVMDDEEIVTLVVGEMLRSLGYEVDFAEHGEEAVQKYETAMKAGTAFDTVILDLTVRGGMGGKEAIRRLLDLDPGVSAVVSSGYSDDPVVSNFRDFGFKDILSKPYEIGRLSSVLYTLLGAEGKGRSLVPPAGPAGEKTGFFC